MKIGFVGLGKLGLPVAKAIASKGHEVIGYDINRHRLRTAREEGLNASGLLTDSVIGMDIVFVAVQTPHHPQFEGITRLPDERRDFDYSFLAAAARDIATVLKAVPTAGRPAIVVVSTVLPGTMEREILPLLKDCPVAYNPSFIAMGTVERDFLDPEFVLVGYDDSSMLGREAAMRLSAFYETVADAPIHWTTIRNAELIKVSYNTMIGLKLAFANTLMEICHKTGCDVDDVTRALKKARRRLISPAYLTAGMGDGGGCHPRDNIALSWLAREHNLSYDLFEAVMTSREKQAEWLADLMCETVLPKAILGTHYKPGVNIRTGSHALLVKSILEERGYYVYEDIVPEPCAVLIGCKEPAYQDYEFPAGSRIIDPWRFIDDRPGVTVVRLGDGARHQPVSLLRQ